MRFSFTALTRLIIVSAIGVNVVAIGVGRWSSQAPATAWPAHVGKTPLILNGYFFSTFGQVLHLLDPETGTISELRLPSANRIEQASQSPWKAEGDRTVVAGRWVQTAGSGVAHTCLDFGLTRMVFPTGEILNRVATDVVPSSPPCWYPGSSDRILFSGTDGDLYQLSFADPKSDKNARDGFGEPPQRLPWVTEPQNKLLLQDAVWPTDRRLGGRVIVSMSEVRAGKSERVVTPARLWWIQLDAYGAAIVAAGPLGVSDGTPAGRVFEERHPTVSVTSDGRMVIAYYVHSHDAAHWQLRLAPLEIDQHTGEPRMLRSAAKQATDNCAPAAPAFSADGRWVSCLRYPQQPNVHVEKFSVDEILGGEAAE